MPHVYITGIGQDKPGIVAALTRVVNAHSGNIEDTTMTILGTQFACIMIGSFPDSVSLESLQSAYHTIMSDVGMQVVVQEIPRSESAAGNNYEESSYMISVAGRDKMGITYEIVHILARHQVNITDLNAKTIHGDDGPIYIMMVEAQLPKDIKRDVFEQDLASMGESLNVEVTYHPVEQVAL